MVKRSKPNVAVLSNLYNVIKETIQDKEVYYTSKQIEELKNNPQNVFLKLNKKGANNGNL